MTQALLAPSASPYALTAGGGPVEVRFAVRLTGKNTAEVPVYLRRMDNGQVYPMSEIGNAHGNGHGKDIYDVRVVIDTSIVPADTCLPFEAYMDSGGAELASAAMRLCVSSFPIGIAPVNISNPAKWGDDTQGLILPRRAQKYAQRP